MSNELIRFPGKPPFLPTVQMRAFRSLAEVMFTEGKIFLRAWLDASKRETRFMDPVRKKDWDAWMELEGFKDWFYENLPEMTAPTEEDMSVMETIYWESVKNGLMRGESWAAKEFAARRWPAKGGQDKLGQGALANEVQEFLASGSGHKWKLVSDS